MSEKELCFPKSGYHPSIPNTTNDHSIFEFVDKDTMYSVGIPSVLSMSARALVCRQIDDYIKCAELPRVNMVGNYLLMPDYYIPPFGWMGLATKKDGLEYQGSFMKRLVAFLWKEHSIKLSQALVAQLGSAIGQDAKDNVLHFRFDPYISYQRGEFGDDGSCYWGDRQGAKMLIRNEGGSFIEFYDNPDGRISPVNGRVVQGHGLARCWILPINQWVDSKAPVFILCNIYAQTSGISRFSIARAVATQLGMSYKMGDICSNLDVFWINSGSGFVMTEDPELLERVCSDTIEVEYDDGYTDRCDPLQYGNHCDEWDTSGGRSYQCQHCDNYFPEDEMATDDYCQECYDELYDECESCGGHWWGEDGEVVDCDGTYLCQRCAHNRGYYYCDECNEWHDNVTEVNGNWICECCLEDYYTKCEECDEWVRKNHVLTVEKDGASRSYCEACLPEEEKDNFARCQSCHLLKPKTTMKLYRVASRRHGEVIDFWLCEEDAARRNICPTYGYPCHRYYSHCTNCNTRLPIEGDS